jgi:prepilin-type N-terminal cleavage/methylation domain-containing protein
MTGKILSTSRLRRAPLRRNLRKDPAAAGFTLIEVVLALTIFALLGTILYGAFALSHSALAKSQSVAARSQAQRSTADLLGSYIRSAYPYRSSPQEQAIYFEGASDSLTFISAYSHGMGGRGIAKIQITADEDDNGRSPLRLEEVTPVRVSGDEIATGQNLRVILRDRISKFRISYLDPQAEDETWQERWDGQERRILPRAVRFTFADESGIEVRWIFPIMMVVLAP